MPEAPVSPAVMLWSQIGLAALWIGRELLGQWASRRTHQQAQRTLQAVATGISVAKAVAEAARAGGYDLRDIRVVDDLFDRLERAGLGGAEMTKALEVAERELGLTALRQSFRSLAEQIEAIKTSPAMVPIDEQIRRRRASRPPDTLPAATVPLGPKRTPPEP